MRTGEDKGKHEAKGHGAKENANERTWLEQGKSGRSSGHMGKAKGEQESQKGGSGNKGTNGKAILRNSDQTSWQRVESGDCVAGTRQRGREGVSS